MDTALLATNNNNSNNNSNRTNDERTQIRPVVYMAMIVGGSGLSDEILME